MRGLLGSMFWALAVLAQDWPTQQYNSENFTAPFFAINSTSTPVDDGYLFLGYFKTEPESLQAPMIFDRDHGNLVWHGPSGGPVYNFRRQVLNGQIVLTYWRGFLDYQGHGYGNVTILDSQYNELYNVCLPESENSRIYDPRKSYPGDTQYPCYLDKHESLITDQGTILLTAYNATQMDLTAVGGAADGWVWDCLFYEMDPITQNIIFKWSAVDHVPAIKSNYLNTTGDKLLNIAGRTYGGQKQPWDYFHINSVQKIDGGYLINSRMTWSFYKIDGDSGDIIWTLEGSNGGDFSFNDEIFFSWQHMPRSNPENAGTNSMEVQLFNNDNIPQVAQNVNSSSGYLLNLDLDTMAVSVVRELSPSSPIYAVAEGSYQDLAKNHVLLGYGAIPIVEEFDQNNDIIWSAQFGPNAEGAPHSYRAYRFPWKSTPNTSPKIVASAGQVSPKKLAAYMSWNGATQYNSWNVYAGQTADNLTLVASKVKRTGFETKASFKNGKNKFQYVMAQALRNGQVLGNSTVQAVS